MADVAPNLTERDSVLLTESRLAAQYGQFIQTIEAAQSTFDSLVALAHACPNSDEAIDSLRILLGHQCQVAGQALEHYRAIRDTKGRPDAEQQRHDETVNTVTNPWAPAQGDLKTALSGALDAFNSTYKGPGIADMNPNVTAGLNTVLANAGTGSNTALANQAGANLSGTLANGGLSQQQLQALQGIGGALGGFNGAMGSAEAALNPYVSGQYLSQPNPYLQQAVSTSMQDAADAINRQFSASGRYGSGANTKVLADRLGNIANNAYMGDYQQQQANQLSAINSLGSLASTGLSGNLSGLGQIGNLGQQGIANTGAAISSIPALAAAQNTDAQNQINVGSQLMGYDQSKIDAANQNPWIGVGNLASVASGIGGLGGTSNSTATQTTDTGLGGILGGGMLGLGALKNLGGLSGIASLFTGSDERIKDDIQKVGKLDNGLNVYSYRYKGDVRPQIGLIAQEVEKVNPDAVREFNGVKAVNYGLAALGSKKAA